MNKVLFLAKIILKNSSNLFVTSTKSKKEAKPFSRVLGIIGLVLLYAYVSVIMGVTFFQMTNALVPTNETALMNPVLALIVIGTALFFGLFSMLSTFFTASDNHLWLHLPLKIEEIFTARFISTIAFLLIMQMMFVLPAFIGYDLAAQPGILSYFGQFFLFFSLPILVIALSFILMVLLSKIINIQRHRKIFQIISGIFVFIFAMGITIVSNSYGSTSGEDLEIIVQAIRSLNVSLNWASFITYLTNPAFINLGYQSIVFPLIIALVAGLFFFLAYKLAGALYHSSLYSVDIAKKKLSLAKGALVIKPTAPALAFFKNEVKTIFRSPTYALNLASPIAMMLIITIISGIGLFSADPTASQELINAFKLVFDPSQGYVFVIGIGVTAFFYMMNMISATAFTREGNNAQMLKIYPVNTRQIIYGKMLLGVVINTSIMTILILTLGIIMQANFFIILAFIISTTLLNILMNYVSLLLDARFPLLNWTNEIEAAKQNKNILISMGVNFVIMSLVIGLAPLFFALQSPTWVSFGILTILILAFIGLCELIVHKQGPRLLKRL